jgi:hypothetical protein
MLQRLTDGAQFTNKNIVFALPGRHQVTGSTGLYLWVSPGGDTTHFAREHVEECLAHQVGNEVERAYRRATALEKRRVIMEAWAEYCCSGLFDTLSTSSCFQANSKPAG